MLHMLKERVPLLSFGFSQGILSSSCWVFYFGVWSSHLLSQFLTLIPRRRLTAWWGQWWWCWWKIQTVCCYQPLVFARDASHISSRFSHSEVIDQLINAIWRSSLSYSLQMRAEPNVLFSNLDGDWVMSTVLHSNVIRTNQLFPHWITALSQAA